MNFVKSAFEPLLEVITLILEKESDYKYTVKQLERYADQTYKIINDDYFHNSYIDQDDDKMFLLACAKNKIILNQEVIDRYKDASFNGYSAYSFLVNNDADDDLKMVQLGLIANFDILEKDKKIYYRYIKR
jgi:hypothetical protein